MRRLVAAEALKLRTTRASAGLAAAALLVGCLGTTAVALTVTSGTAAAGRQALAAPGVVQAFALVLGVLAVTSEHRHGTISATLLVTPRRSRVVAAKLVAAAGLGAALGLLVFGAAAAIALPALEQRGVPSGLSGGDVAAVLAGGAAGTALFAALGVALGAAVRHQVGAVVLALGWLYVVEQVLALVPALADPVRRFGLTGLSSGVTATAGPDPGVDLLGQVPAGLALVGVVGLVLAVALPLTHRDVTG